MRKSILAASIAVAVMATSASAANVGLDIKGGINLANIKVKEEAEGQKSRLAFTGGVALPIGIGKMFAIQPEILITGKGMKAEFEGTTTTVKTSHLDIPVLFKLNIPAGEKITPNVYVGPTTSFLLGAKMKIKGDGIDTTITEVETLDDEGNEVKESLKDQMQNLDFGLAFGGGVNIKAGEKGHVITDLRYTLGLRDINVYPEGYTPTDDDKAKNGGFSVMLGYGFKF